MANDQKSYGLTALTVSPRRRGLLKKLFPSIRFAAPAYRETRLKYFPFPLLLSLYHAWRKLASVKAGKGPVMAFDTIVYRGLRIYSKPQNKDEAERMILALSGRRHRVATGMAARMKGRIKFSFAVSRVCFKKLSRNQARAYVRTGLWKGKAGGYGIQDRQNTLIENYKGDYFNIMGLPLYRIPGLFSNGKS